MRARVFWRGAAVPFVCALWVAPPLGPRVSAPEIRATPATTSYDLASYLDSGRIDSASVRSFVRAAELVRAGKSREGQRAYEAVARSTPGLSDWAHLLAADAAARQGDTTTVRAQLALGAAWLSREWGWRIRVRGIQTATTKGEAAHAALGEAEVVELESSRTHAQRVAAELMLANGDTAPALSLLRTILSSGATAADAKPAAVLLASATRQPADLLQSATILVAAGDFKTTSSLLPKVMKHPGLAGSARSRVRLELARHHFGARRYPAARQLANDLANDSAEPDGARAEARLLLGRTLLREAKRSPAVAQLRTVLEGKPGPAAAEAAFMLADLREGGATAARKYYERAARLAPSTAPASESMVRLGTEAFAARDYASAMQWFEQAVGGHAQHRQRALYWVARTQLALGDSAARSTLAEVIAIDPLSYYAFLATKHADVQIAMPSGPAIDSLAKRRAGMALTRLNALRNAGLADLEAFEYRRVRNAFSNDDHELYAMAEALQEDGQTQRAIALGRELQRKAGTWDTRLLRVVYPFPYRNIIIAEAAKHGVDAFIAAALIRQESAFNPRAKSSAGALGLMQVMPRTGAAVARKMGISKVSPARLYDPGLNVQLGMDHLSSLLNWHSGRIVHVLSAYNAGAGRLNQWLSFPEAVDDELFTERIPFAETRDYVRIVQQNAHIYRLAYLGDPAEAVFID